MKDEETVGSGESIPILECNLEQECKNLRDCIRDTGATVKTLMNHNVFKGEETFGGQHGEMRANLMLSFRHLEDARMRLGKVMQQIQGGVSIFDRPEGQGTGTLPPKE